MASQPVGQVPGSLIDWAAGVIGISPAVVRAQINMESGGQPGSVSSANAQGVAQFLPSTWSGLGCSGSPFNVGDSMRCYAKYMYQLVQQFHGNVRDALAAYNAGPGNLAAGYGYADSILAAAGQSSNVRAGAGTGMAASASAQASATAAGSTAAVAGTKDPACAWGVAGGIPVLSNLPIVGSTFTVDICFVHKSTIRHMVGGLLMGAGFLIMLPGVVIVIAAGFQQSRAAQAVARSAQAVPGYGRVARRAQAPSPARAPARAPAWRIPKGRVAAGGRRPRQIEGKLPDTGKPQQIEGTLPS